VAGTPTASSLLMVCTGNICRSPMAERIAGSGLRRRLGPAAGRRIAVSSAGTHGRDCEPMAPYAAEVLAQAGIDPSGFVARTLTKPVLADADLVLTATRAHRAATVTLLPRVVSRTFTLLEFARLVGDTTVGELDAHPAPSPVGSLARLAAARRGQTAPATSGADDLADPYLGPIDGFRACREALAVALATPLDLLAAAVNSASCASERAQDGATTPTTTTTTHGSPPTTGSAWPDDAP
jgi:protein-tyrosine phosphatase